MGRIRANYRIPCPGNVVAFAYVLIYIILFRSFLNHRHPRNSNYYTPIYLRDWPFAFTRRRDNKVLSNGNERTNVSGPGEAGAVVLNPISYMCRD